MMTKIKTLAPEVANQIAAGEVVSGPVSVCKELVENAVDAGATSVTIVLEDAGKTFLSVQDNGSGVSKDDLPLLVKRHSTSKLKHITDLDAMSSMGFRGEALASIASVSRFRAISQMEGQAHAWQLTCESDSSEDVVISAYDRPFSVGTLIEVRDLFFRVPARQKFLGSDVAEGRKVKDMIKKMILAHPQVAFTLRHADKVILQAPACHDEASSLPRVQLVMGKDFAQSAIWVSQDLPWGRLQGWCARAHFNRRSTDMQLLFLNHRPVRDKKLSFALKRAYADIILPGRHPAFCLFLDVHPHLVDVNVHPSKDEVRFTDADEITRSLKYVVEQALRRADHAPTDPVSLSQRLQAESTPMMTSNVSVMSSAVEQSVPVFSEQHSAQAQFGIRGKESESMSAIPAFVANSTVFDAGQKVATSDSNNQEFNAVSVAEESSFHAQGTEGASGMFDGLSSLSDQAVGAVLPSAFEQSLDIGRMDSVARGPGAHQSSILDLAQKDLVVDQAALLDEKGLCLGFALGQLHGAYVLAQSEAGLVIVDMHAAHERIVYERMKAEYAHQGVTCQKLLVPYSCRESDISVDIVEEYGVLLLQMGLELVVQDGAVFLHAIPAVLSKKDMGGLVQSVVADLLRYQASDQIQAALNHIFATMACHAAIRANRVLTQQEMNELLRQIEKTHNSDYCNHGRPTWFVWSMKSLDAVFRRGQ